AKVLRDAVEVLMGDAHAGVRSLHVAATPRLAATEDRAKEIGLELLLAAHGDAAEEGREVGVGEDPFVEARDDELDSGAPADLSEERKGRSHVGGLLGLRRALLEGVAQVDVHGRKD